MQLLRSKHGSSRVVAGLRLGRLGMVWAEKQGRKLRCARLDRTGPEWTGLGWTGPDWTGLDRTGPDWTGLDRTGLDWTGLDATGLDWLVLAWIGSTLTWSLLNPPTVWEMAVGYATHGLLKPMPQSAGLFDIQSTRLKSITSLRSITTIVQGNTFQDTGANSHPRYKPPCLNPLQETNVCYMAMWYVAGI